MTVAEARAVCGELRILPWDDAVIARAIDEVTAVLLATSPQVTPAAGEPGLWWVGAGGLDGFGGEQSLLLALTELARPWHPRPRVAVADSCVAARAATWANRRERSAVIVPPGGDAAYLADAPLALIPMDEEMRAMLTALGLKTAGALAALEAHDVERRWGDVGLAAWRLARGEDRRRPVLTRPDARRSVEAELSTPTDVTEPVLFLVRAALDRLVTDLVADGRAAATVAITLTLDRPRGALPVGAFVFPPGATPSPSPSPSTPPHTVTREIRLAHPLARVKPLFEHCRALLERWAPDSLVSGITVAITATAPASGEQGDLLSSAWRDPAALDAAFARLRNELGPDAVVRPVLCDEHRPERTGAWAPQSDARLADRQTSRWTAGGEAVSRCEVHGLRDQLGSCASRPRAERARAPELTLESGSLAPHHSLLAPASPARLLEPPEPVEIERTNGELSAMWWRGCRLGIARAVGPERLSGDWWKDGYVRDYWRCEVEREAGGGGWGASETGDFLLFLDHTGEGQWYLHGWYD